MLFKDHDVASSVNISDATPQPPSEDGRVPPVARCVLTETNPPPIARKPNAPQAAPLSISDPRSEDNAPPDGAPGCARPRVAIIGGGIGGISTAYFLGGECEVDLFESRPKIGGHCDSQIVDYQGYPITVDLGAQFFHPKTHPLYVTLLEELDIYDPNDRGNDQTLDAPGSLCMFTASGLWPVLSTEYPLLNPITCIDFATYVHEAREVILQDKSWEMTLEDWISTLSVRKGFVDKVLYPWISASIGCTRANASRVSARSILQTFALAFENTSGSTTMNSKLGTGGNLHRLLDRIVGTKVHLNSPINELTMVNGKWFLRSPERRHGPFDAVVMNAPPYQSKHLLKPLGHELQADNADNTSLPALARLLSTYEYFDARIVIHTDAKYTYRHKHLWAMYNGGIDGIECEGSVWYGRIHPKLPNGGRVDIFKSFASRRRHNPANILCERSFKHPLITPKVIRAARALQGFQGRNNLYFAGHFTTGMDLQEAAVYSGLKVAETLAPSSASIASLKKRLKARGRDGVSYEL